MAMSKREKAKVLSVDWDISDRPGCVSVLFGSDGWGQGLSLVVGDLRQQFRTEMMRLFATSDAESLVDRECYVLRAGDGWGENIIGIEVNGRRWTRNGFCSRHGLDATSERERRRESLLSEIDHHRRRIVDSERSLERLGEIEEWEDTLTP